MKIRMPAILQLTTILCATAIIAVIGPLSLRAQERARAGYSGISGYQVPLWLGVDLGLFKKYGLNLEPILFRGGAESTHALTGGEIQFDVVAPQPHIAADLSGAEIIIIGTYFNKHTYSVIARSGIRSPQELRGKKIGVLSVVGLNQIVVATALRHWGIEEKSVTLIRAGGSRDRLTALQNGLIDATVVTGAFVDRARAAGMTVLLDLGDLEDSFATVSMMTTRTIQSAKRNLVKGFFRASARPFMSLKPILPSDRRVWRSGCELKTKRSSKARIAVTPRGFLFRLLPNSPAFRSPSTIWPIAAPTPKVEKRRSSSMKKSYENWTSRDSSNRCRKNS